MEVMAQSYVFRLREHSLAYSHATGMDVQKQSIPYTICCQEQLQVILVHFLIVFGPEA